MDYANSRLTAVYDALNPAVEDHRFYLELAAPPPRRPGSFWTWGAEPGGLPPGSRRADTT